MNDETKKQSAQRKTREAEKKFAALIRRHVVSHRMPDGDEQITLSLLGYGNLTNTMLASDLRSRRQSTKILGQTLEKLRDENPDLNFYFLTFTHDIGNTIDREPIIRLKALQKMVDKTLRKLKLHGISVVEIQGVGNFPAKGEGRLIMLHAHAIAWTNENFDADAAMDRIKLGTTWTNVLTKNAVDIKRVTDRAGHLQYVSYYSFKPPYDVKMVEERVAGQKFKSTEVGYRPDFAFRLLEIMCQLDINCLVRAVGDGVAIRREWKRRLTNWHRSRALWSGIPSHNSWELEAYWTKYRRRKKKIAYAEPVFIR